MKAIQSHTHIRKFLVISWNSDEQRSFFDHVIAVSHEKAKDFITTHRPYVTDIVDCMDLHDVDAVKNSLKKRSLPDMAHAMRELVVEFVADGGY